jgi:hypothetical protein
LPPTTGCGKFAGVQNPKFATIAVLF